MPNFDVATKVIEDAVNHHRLLMEAARRLLAREDAKADTDCTSFSTMSAEVARLQRIAERERWSFPVEAAVELSKLALALYGAAEGRGSRISGAVEAKTAAPSFFHSRSSELGGSDAE